MEEENQESNELPELEEDVKQQDPIELMFTKIEEKILTNRRHIKALYEEVKLLKDNFKLWLDEKE